MRIIIRNLSEDEYSKLLMMKKTFHCKRWDCLARGWIIVYDRYLESLAMQELNELVEAFEDAIVYKAPRKKIRTWRGLKNDVSV